MMEEGGRSKRGKGEERGRRVGERVVRERRGKDRENEFWFHLRDLFLSVDQCQK